MRSRLPPRTQAGSACSPVGGPPPFDADRALSSDDYDAEANAIGCYEVAINALRENLERQKLSKYKAIPVIIDGIRFASQAEGRRYAQLKLLERAGEISRLELQPAFKCEINGKLVCTYRGDFRYFTKDGCVTEDCKGYPTPLYRLKKKLVEALYPGVKITEVK